MAKEAGMHLQINTTITRSTLGEFDDFVELVKKMKPGMWSVFLLVPTGRGRSGSRLEKTEQDKP